MRKSAFRLFKPILAGATLSDRSVAAVGAGLGLAVAALVCAASPVASGLALPALLAPFGASAVLVFAVPASPMAQPWAVFGGNVVSAIVGMAVGGVLGAGFLAIGVGVAAAILVMSLLRCLHPPGGAMAMTAVMGGPAIWSATLAFPFGVVALNAVAVLAVGWLFHRVSGHSYPHRPAPAAPTIPLDTFHHDDIRRALDDTGEAFDISPADLEILLERAEHHARARSQRPA